MSTATIQSAHDVLDFWFGPMPLDKARLEARMRVWFAGESDQQAAARYDQEIRGLLVPLLNKAVNDQLANWSASPRRRLALILLFDQVPRNAFRGTAAAYSFDDRALALTVEGLRDGADAPLDPVERLFFYMPLQHAELRSAQEESLRSYRRLSADAPAELRGIFDSVLTFAEKHAAIIQQFGRFPYRNRVLQRETTAAEKEWLATSGESFGQ
ncbi:MAG: DUF924 domain-containing protein [Proteobacteria bacterium]|nr:DUF924 domain-containing protein [Pseudomonadota bacterium]